ncbi:hypothetical protein RJ640_020101 [Escallonia rubra]|uniref:Uncharacterized protein n=1 Tax=Escallonia rubra TaxID=112253 RepID=A0AA88QYQ8_9ASTE|nr:hypothetical protein RJ640_020101 [Escallonia rubra]
MAIQEALKLAGGFDFPYIFPSLTFFHSISRAKLALEEIHRKVDNILQEIIKDHTTSNRPSAIAYTKCPWHQLLSRFDFTYFLPSSMVSS